MRIRSRRFLGLVFVAAAAVIVAAALVERPATPRDVARNAARLAAERLAAGQTREARRLAESALALDPDSIDARYLRAVTSCVRGDRAGALADLERCANAEPQDCVACLDAALVARGTSREASRGWYEEARRRACAAMERDPDDVRAALVDAASCVALGRLDDADRRLRGLHPLAGELADDAEALRAAVLVARGADADALALLRRAIDERHSSALSSMAAEIDAAPAAMTRAGVDALRRGDVPLARALLRDAVARSRGDLAPVALLAATLAGPDAARAAQDETRRLADRDPRGAARTFLVADVLLAAGDVDGAAVGFRRALDLAPDDPSALRGAVLGELSRGRAEAAEKLCRERLPSIDARGDVEFLLGASLEEAGHDDGAEASYRAALRKDASNWPAADRLSELLLARGDVAEAADVCDAGLAADARCLPLRIRRADAWIAVGEPAKAAKMLASEAAARPDCAALRLHWARALDASGDRAGAAAQFDACRRADPSCVEAQVGAVALAASEGRLDAVAADLRQQCDARPRDPVPRFALGVAAEAAGDLDSAERAYLDALTLAPRFAAAANNLAWLLAVSRNHPEQARRLAELAGSLLPRNPHVLDTRGWVRFLNGDLAGADADLARAERLLPGRSDVAARRAETLAALQRKSVELEKETPR